MSNDLISRKALSENICNTESKIPNFESESELNAFMLGLNVKQIAVMKCLSDQSTAYAPDKVVEQITNLTAETFIIANDSAYIPAKETLDIVKGGVE